jgi:predicted nucleic acid-binding protein
MIERHGIVLDANILLRAVFGQRVRHLLKKYENQIGFYAPDICFRDARKYVIKISEQQGLDPNLGLAVLDQISNLVEPIDRGLYEQYQHASRERIALRDPDDWPIVAVALLFHVPVWTEDQDFFGSGIATWTTDRVELYLQGS